jgi:hypothetical protein
LEKTANFFAKNNFAQTQNFYILNPKIPEIFTISRDKSPSTLLLIFAFCISVFPCLIVGKNSSPIYCQPENPNPNGTDFGPMWFKEVPIPQLYVELTTQKSLWFYSGTTITVVYYLVTIVYGVLTMKELNKKFSLVMYNKAAKSTQKQLTKTMIAQVSVF